MEQITLPIRGLNLAATRTVNGTGSHKVIALHGWLDNSASFSLLTPLIKDADIIAVDLSGHGYSDHRSKSSSYAFQEYIFDLYEILRYVNKQFSWKDISLFGHSMGAIISALYASAHFGINAKYTLRKLVFFDFLGTLNEPAEIAADRIIFSLKSYSRINQAKKVIYPTLEDAVKLRREKSDITEEHAALILRRGLKKIDNHYCWRFDRKLLQTSMTYLTPEQTASIVKSIKQPILTFLGKQSTYYPMLSQRVKEYKGFNLDIKSVELNGGHYVHMENTEAVAQIINEFLTT